MRIFISKKDIQDGVAHNCKRCPVARALVRRLKALKNRNYEVEVGKTFYSINGYVGALPFKAQAFVKQYDTGNTVHPCCIDFPNY